MVAEIFIEKCIGCGWCIDVCPHQIIEFTANNKVLITEEESCIECGACALQCPTDAILSHPEGCGCISSVVKKKFRRIFHLSEPKKQNCC